MVGCGVVSRVHLDGLQRSPLTELAAVCDLDEQLADETARSYGVSAYYDHESLLGSEQLDWLHVCTPVQSHRLVSVSAIEAGVPVLIEKPTTVTVDEFEEIADAARANGVTFSAVRNHLFLPSVVETLEELDAGAYGELRGVDVVYTGNTPPDRPNRGSWTFDLPGGEFEEGIPHPIYLALGIGGLPRDADDVVATTSLFGDYEREFEYDGLQLAWTTADEVQCSVRTMAGAIPQRLVLVHGEDRSATIDLTSSTVVGLDRNYIASPKHRALNNVDRVVDRVGGTLDNVLGVAKRRFSSDWETEKYWDAHYRQFDLEAAALQAGEGPAVPPEQVRWTVALVELVRRRASERAAEPPELADAASRVADPAPERSDPPAEGVDRAPADAATEDELA